MAPAHDNDKIQKAIVENAARIPRAATNKPFTYGTAGFRMNADLLDYVMFTVGILASLRSRRCNGKTIGVMITASHNPAEDNGVKLVDPMGEMLDPEWEKWAAEMANTPTPEALGELYKKALFGLRVDQSDPAAKAVVIYARDTRPSGARLVKALEAGLNATDTTYIDFAYLTTPQLHYLVRSRNTQAEAHPYGEPSEEGYYKKLADAFGKALGKYSKVNGPVTVDCANGVGAPKLKKMIEHLGADCPLKINVVNDKIEQAEVLNKNCGADFVKTQQRAPPNFNGKPYDRWASFDGDADRIVYYYQSEGSQFHLLDGDRIAGLAAMFLGELVRRAGLWENFNVAVVQTAYANGGSSKYVEDILKLVIEITPTGVKHLHHVASRYDIGIYFEANGHGTVLFSERAERIIKRKYAPETPGQLEALETLRGCIDLINQTVGDAISDLLLVEVMLAQKQWSVQEWLGLYDDLPNKIAKVKVPNKDLFKTVPMTAERKLAEPAGLQDRIDSIVKKYKDGRCFVRASGTEDAVRVYGEAAEPYDVDDMVGKVTELIRDWKM